MAGKGDYNATLFEIQKHPQHMIQNHFDLYKSDNFFKVFQKNNTKILEKLELDDDNKLLALYNYCL